MLHLTVVALVAAATLSYALPSNPLPKPLTENDIIVFGSNGRVEVMKRDEYHILSRDLYSKTPAPLATFENSTTEVTPPSKLAKRCSTEQVFTLNPDVSF